MQRFPFASPSSHEPLALFPARWLFLIFPLYRLMYLLAMNGNLLRGDYTEANLVASDIDHRHNNRTPDNDAFVSVSA